MRPLKFRAWNSNTNEMISWEQIGDDHWDLWTEFRVCETMMQFTGLKDRNGKEIYEGDVIQYKSYSVFKRWWSDTKEIPVIEAECKAQREDFQIVRNAVEFRDGGFMLGYHLTMRDVSRGQKFERGQSSHGDTESKEWDFEVIGNVWQNPELIKQ